MEQTDTLEKRMRPLTVFVLIGLILALAVITAMLFMKSHEEVKENEETVAFTIPKKDFCPEGTEFRTTSKGPNPYDETWTKVYCVQTPEPGKDEVKEGPFWMLRNNDVVYISYFKDGYVHGMEVWFDLKGQAERYACFNHGQKHACGGIPE